MERIYVCGKDIGPTLTGPLTAIRLLHLNQFFISNMQEALDPVVLLTKAEKLVLDGNHRLTLSWLYNKPIRADIFEEGEVIIGPEGLCVAANPCFLEAIRMWRKMAIKAENVAFADLYRSSFNLT